MSLSIILAFLATGVLSGTVAGLLGVGGGMILVPVIVWILASQGLAEGYAIKIALASSLAIIIPTSVSSALAHYRSGALRMDIVKHMLSGIILGTVLGGLLVDQLPERWLRIIFAAGCWIIAAKMLFGGNPQPSRSLPGTVVLNIVGSIIGSLSALLGIGGGSLTVPFLHYCNINMRSAVATSSACGLPIAIAGAITLALRGMYIQELPPYSLGYVYLPAFVAISITAIIFAPLGAKLAHSLPVATLKKVVAIFLVIAGTKMTASVMGWF